MREAIIVNRLGKRFNRYHAEKPVTIMEAALAGLGRMKAVEHFWALREVSFTVSAGEMLGIIGHNGAGKSTLLQLVGGVGAPDEGKIKVRGRIGALLDLGAGFNGDLTGRENVFVAAIVAGLTRREVQRRFETMVEFAELEEFIDNPLRTYSTGMQMRLAFSVAVHTDPDVLLVDEFLSVGDLSFQAKCLERIGELKEKGCAIVLISHSAEQIEELCDRALWLRQGQIVAYGEPEVVVGQYVSEMRQQTQQRTPLRAPQKTKSGTELRVNENRFGSLEIEITDVRLQPRDRLDSGEPLRVEIDYLSPQRIESPIFSVTISREDGQICFDTSTAVTVESLSAVEGEGQISLQIDRVDLSGGSYFVDVGIYERDWTYAYDYHWHVYPLEICSAVDGNSILNPPLRWEMGAVRMPSLGQVRQPISDDKPISDR
ncbi:ABC transporter ATP-binding protein [Oscillatoria sp. FACHB-1406]|uniref:ABC transporter ATP-binding protein n=1 Tax=Oscillatoria sp. FACHB-1406 TaxID=2692846 RepID=UPI0016863813|nr:ABC transporter ATP-binding protein [Oscillatoria sp. FACHB-1406]MBD2578572.1 ABC transporter ATP-binding protein [Oscillatoria sp. FACHB-1406]